MRSALDRGLFGLAFLLLVTVACETPPDCGNPPICALPECQDHPDCTDNGQEEICDNGIDDDGDGRIDADDPACVDDTSPVQEVDCVGQDTITSAGDDVDTWVDSEDCDDPVQSESGDGDAASAEIVELGDGAVGAFVDVEDTGGIDPPSATITMTVLVTYEGGGDHFWYSALDVSAIPLSSITTSCTSGGYTVEVDAHGWVPTDPRGGTATCTSLIAITGDGSTAHHKILLGTSLARDGDDDGTSDRNDVWCPDVAGDEDGCPESGTFGPGGIYVYHCKNPSTCHIEPDPTPDFCTECLATFGDVEIDARADGASLLARNDGTLLCDDCGVREEGSWSASGGDFTLEPFARLLDCVGSCGIVDDAGEEVAGCEECELIAEVDDLPEVDVIGEIAAETADPAQNETFPFSFDFGGVPFVTEITTEDGIGVNEIFVLSDDAVEVEAGDVAGWEEAESCQGGPVALLDESGPCVFQFTRADTGDFFPTTVFAGELVGRVPFSFGEPDDAAPGPERFFVTGANGIGVYDAATIGLVTSLSTIGGFSIQHALGALFLDAPDSTNDARWYYTTPSGTGQQQWFDTFFGATQISFAAVRDATYVGGDPNLGRGVYVDTTGAVSGLFFSDFGLEWPVLNSAILESGGQTPGFTPTSAFQAVASGPVLVAARSNTAGANGRLFLGSATTPLTQVGDLGVDPRLLRCVSAIVDTWICVVTNFESDVTSVVAWHSSDSTVATVSSFATGDQPLAPSLAAVGDDVLAVVPNFGADTLTWALLDGATGAVLGTSTAGVAAGCVDPSATLLVQNATRVAVVCHGSDGIAIGTPPALP